MDHPRVFLFHKMWLFLWVRLQFAGQLNFVFLFYTGLYLILSSLTETRVIVELKNMSAIWHYEADVSLVFVLFVFYDTAKQLCRWVGHQHNVPQRVCALGFIFVTGLYSESCLGMSQLYFLRSLLELPHPNSLISFVHNRRRQCDHILWKLPLRVSRYCARTCYSAQLQRNTRESGVACDLWMGKHQAEQGLCDRSQGHGGLVRGQ